MGHFCAWKLRKGLDYLRRKQKKEDKKIKNQNKTKQKQTNKQNKTHITTPI